MGIINVKGLGQVRIAGDEPTPAEMQKMRALRDRGAAPPPPPTEEDDGPGFVEQAARAALQSGSAIARGFLLSTPIAIAEALDVEGARIPEGMTAEEAASSPDFEVSPAAWAHKKWEEWEQGVYKPTKTVDEALEGDFTDVLEFIGTGVAGSVPHMIGVLAGGAPRYAASLIGDMARERAKADGRDAPDWGDMAVATGAASLIAPLEKVGAKVAMTGGGGKTMLGRVGLRALGETATELPQTAVEHLGALRPLEDLPSALKGAALVAPVAGAGFGAVSGAPKLPAEMTREASIRHAEELAGGRMPDGVSVAAQDVSPEAAQSLAQNVEVAEEVTAPVPKADPGVPTRPVVGERATPKEIPPDRHVSMAELIKLIADPASTDNEVHAKALEALAREANMEAGLEGPRIAAKHAEMDEVMLQAADELMMSEAAKKALTESQRISIAEVRLAARTQGLDSTMEEGDLGVANMSGKLDALVDSINERGYNPSAIEQAAVHSAVLLQKRAHQDILDAVKSKDTTHSMEELGARLEKTNKQILRLGQALRAAGSEMGRAFRYRQFMANKITTYSDAVATAMLKKKRLLTAGESKRLRKAWDKAVKLEADGLAERKKAHERLQKAQKLMKKAQKSGNEGSIQAAQKLIDQISDDLVKASAKVRLGERERASSISTVTMNRLLRGYKKAFGASLVLSSSGDDSALGRQAMGLFLKNPVKGLKTLPIVWQLAPWTQGHRAYALRTQKAILNADMQAIRDLAGLELTEIEGLSNVPGGGMLAREELFMFRALETGALGDQLVMPSQNAFGLTLNLLRAAHFDQAVKFLAQDYGANPNDIKDIMKKVPKADLQARAALINASTGRGKLVSGQGFGATVMRNIMFAPRFTLSRFESPYRTVQVVLGMGEFEGVSKATRKRIAAETGKRLGFFMGIGLMSTLLGDDDPEENALAFVSPKSGDFLKFRVGDYHIDLTGGLASTWRYVLPLLLGGDRPGAGMSQMVRNKAAPLIGALYDGVRGTDFRGRPVTLDAMKTDKAMEEFFNGKVNDYVAVILHQVVFPATGAFTPITLQNVADEAWSKMTGEEKEELQRILPIALDAFGVGARHYDPKETRRQRRGTIGPSRPSMPQ